MSTRAVRSAVELGWSSFVEQHAGEVWLRCLDAHLDTTSAERVCEMVWLRLAERVNAYDPRLPLTHNDLESWLSGITRVEVRRELARTTWRTGVVDVSAHERGGDDSRTKPAGDAGQEARIATRRRSSTGGDR